MPTLGVLLVLMCPVLSGAALTNVDVLRSVDLSGPIARVTVNVKASNAAGSEPASDYFVAVPAADAEHLSYIAAVGAEGNPLAVGPPTVAALPGSDQMLYVDNPALSMASPLLCSPPTSSALYLADSPVPSLNPPTRHRRPTLYAISLAKPLEGGEEVALSIKMVYTHVFEPHPRFMSQGESQLLRWHGSHTFFSPYPSTTQTTAITLPSLVRCALR